MYVFIHLLIFIIKPVFCCCCNVHVVPNFCNNHPDIMNVFTQLQNRLKLTSELSNICRIFGPSLFIHLCSRYNKARVPVLQCTCLTQTHIGVLFVFTVFIS